MFCSTGSPITDVYSATEEDVNRAVAAARKAYKGGWRKTSGPAREALLKKFIGLLKRDFDVIAAIEAWDAGKAYDVEAVPNTTAAIECFEYYAGWATKISGETIEMGNGKLGYTIREPLGVCGQIIPWNYPLLMAAWKLAPALAAGNCVVLKLAENTPLSVLYLAKLFKEAGFPPGVVNIFTGLGKVAGAALASHQDVDKIAFTGSTATGKTIMKLAASNLKNITLECGGKSPMIIFKDADLKLAVESAHGSLFANQGQICTAMSRYFVEESIYEKFLELFKQHVEKSSIVGGVFEDSVFQGPQISDIQHKKVLEYIESGKNEGGRLVLGGKIPASREKGYFVEPTIFADVKDYMKIMKEEIFGPVASVSKFSTEQEAIDRANDSYYGLGASVFTNDLGTAHRVASELESGQVWINCPNGSDPRMPFGGVKGSGIGRELGKYGLDIYTSVKAVHLQIPNLKM